MKSKGFTLVELLAVIVILGLVAVIAVPNVASILNNSKNSLNNNQKEIIESAARQWGIEHVALEGNNPSKSYVDIKTLQDDGFLEDKSIKNLIDNEDVSLSTKICITYANNQFVYTYKGDC